MSQEVEIKAISAQPTEVGVGLSWAELGNIGIIKSVKVLFLNLPLVANRQSDTKC